MKNSKNDIHTVIIKGISVTLLFAAAVALVLIALFMFSTRGEFVKAASGEISLSPSFYITAFAVILLSSIMYTPFSFGISNYFLKSKSGDGSFKQIFYLFKAPRLMVKAILMNSIRQSITALWRILVLVSAVVVECGLFVISVVLSGENIFDYEHNFLSSVAHFITTDRFFILLTLLEWCAVIIALFVIKIRFIFCKYALIRYPALGIIEAVRVGEFSIRGKMVKTVLFYYKYLTMYIFTFLTLGLSGAIIKNKRRDSFSTFAVREVERGIDAYYRQR